MKRLAVIFVALAIAVVCMRMALRPPVLTKYSFGASHRFRASPLLAVDPYYSNAPKLSKLEGRTSLPDAIKVTGEVLLGAKGTTAEALGIRLSVDSGSGEPRVFDARTDERGRFEIELPLLGWLPNRMLWTNVLDLEDRVLLAAAAPAAENLIFLVPPPAIVQGRVSWTGSLDPSKATIGFYSLANPSPVLCAGSDLDRNGNFGAVVPSHLVSAYYLIILRYDKHYLLNRMFSANALASSQGVRIDCATREFVLQVLQEDGVPIPSASVSVAPASLPSFLPASSWLTDSQGNARFVVPIEGLELCIGAVGYEPVVATVEDDPRTRSLTRHFTMHSYQEGSLISGVVIDQLGAPVPRAYVISLPETKNLEVAVAGKLDTYTDEAGHFRLHLPQKGSVSVQAHATGRGHSSEIYIDKSISNIILQFEPTGSAEIRLEQVGVDIFPIANGPTQYAACHLERQHDVFGVGDATIELNDLPLGNYNVFVRLPGATVSGQTLVTLSSDISNQIDLVLSPSSWFEGTLVDTEGRPLEGFEVQVRLPEWSKVLSQAWGSATTDKTGFFRVFAGVASSGIVEVQHEGTFRGSFEVELGRSATYKSNGLGWLAEQEDESNK